MRGDIPPLPNTPSWRGAQLKRRDNFTFKMFYTESIRIPQTNVVSTPNKESVAIMHKEQLHSA